MGFRPLSDVRNWKIHMCDIFKMLGIFLEFFGIFFGNFAEILGNFWVILWESFGTLLEADFLHFQSHLFPLHFQRKSLVHIFIVS